MWTRAPAGSRTKTGAGAGQGANRNLPLRPGAGDAEWLEALAALGAEVRGRGADALVISLGVDAAAADPESPLRVTADGYRQAGELIGGLGPAVLVQEGGYDLPSLGGLVVATLAGVQSAAA
jgi:acetoin utilization deacetylase AcuC-like enzyme